MRDDREAFEAAYAEACDKRYTIFQDFKAGWQAALASERAKQAEPVPFNAPGKAHVEAMLGSAALPAVQGEPVALDRWGIKSVPGRPEDYWFNYWFEKMPDGYWTPWHIANEALQRAAPPAVQQAEPVALHIDHITPDDRKRYYDFEKYADHLPTCKQPRGDQSCECGYSAVRINLSDLLDELSAPAQQEPKYVLASERAKQAERAECSYCGMRSGHLAACQRPPADDEAVRLLREARRHPWKLQAVELEPECVEPAQEFQAEVDAYLARVER